MQRGRWDSGRRWDQGKRFWDSFVEAAVAYAKQMPDSVSQFARGQKAASAFPKQTADSQSSFPKNT